MHATRLLALAFAFGLLALPGAGMAGVSVPASLRANRIAIQYVEPVDPAHRYVYDELKAGRIMERFRTLLSPIRLPATLTLKAAGCEGESNAWYEEEGHTVTVCYEYLDGILRNAPSDVTGAGVSRKDAIVGPLVEVVLHEVGHALFHLLEVPVFGREEDAADQLADYLLLQLDDDIAMQAVRGIGYMYAQEMRGQNPAVEDFANVHGLSAQRFFNVLCLAYGKDPKLFADVVDEGYLPESRAESCEGEYRQVKYAFQKLVAPYIDRAVLRKVQPNQLLRRKPQQ
jgi:hypothetical protein